MKKNFLKTMGKTFTIALMGICLVTLTGCPNNQIDDPTPEPDPVITLNTPGGRISWISLANSSTESEVVLEGLKTMQLPAARAGASFHAAIKNGKFHGTI